MFPVDSPGQLSFTKNWWRFSSPFQTRQSPKRADKNEDEMKYTKWKTCVFCIKSDNSVLLPFQQKGKNKLYSLNTTVIVNPKDLHSMWSFYYEKLKKKNYMVVESKPLSDTLMRHGTHTRCAAEAESTRPKLGEQKWCAHVMRLQKGL